MNSAGASNVGKGKFCGEGGLPAGFIIKETLKWLGQKYSFKYDHTTQPLMHIHNNVSNRAEPLDSGDIQRYEKFLMRIRT
ncbi:uncharacterized protein PHALS_04272 [Plasmopara halstedii]|uniref:Uncharacterized protein n=1 Tax=Plasmopara halstedii TaxID=4781 RepID=A0A0N7L7L3_PLAHL|nr:uncharacterized protein PHALS_04272 [Plasmopara halstedii]CEG47395.1 hypothetical protein PHALS_04272 [Plasmopara halstedii]|eukprot:XP_024583764.1 hypothetical protein PHALS_04272 [Plasmopara halstedii]